MTSNSEQLAREISLFKDVPRVEIDQVAPQLSKRKFKAGQTIFDFGDASNNVCFLISGVVLSVLWTEDGKEQVFSRLQLGDYFGELAALDGGTRSLAVYAQSETEVYVINRTDFQAMMANCPSLRDKIIRRLVGHIRTLTERNFQLSSFSVEMRVRSYLVRLALSCGKFCPMGVIEDAPTHAEIANSIGANREAVSRTMAQLNRSEIVASMRKKVTILSPEKLMQGI